MQKWRFNLTYIRHLKYANILLLYDYITYFLCEQYSEFILMIDVFTDDVFHKKNQK